MSIEAVSAVSASPVSAQYAGQIVAADASFQKLLDAEIALRKPGVRPSAAYSNTADALGSLPTQAGDVSRTLPWGAYRSQEMLVVNPHVNAGRTTYSGQATAEIRAQAQPYLQYIEEASATYGVPANLIMAIIKRESDFDPTVTSSSGAMGLMQNMPFNCEEYGLTDPYDPRQSIMCGTWLLGTLLDMYDGDLRMAMAGYAIGCGTLRRAGVTSSASTEYLTRVPEKTQMQTETALKNAGII